MKNKFYWIKLKTDFFTREDIDFLLSQSNGCEYVVLYQILCLTTANTNGELKNIIGEMIVPFDAEKIARDSKYFNIKTINKAMELYKKLELIYEQEDGTLKIAGYEDMVGSESAWAEKKRTYREKTKGQTSDINEDIVLQENRDKRLENRDKIIENRDKSLNIKKKKETDEEHTVAQDYIYCPTTEIIDYLNFKIGSNYKATTDKTKSHIKARLKEGFTLEDFKTVIDKKVMEWSETDMQKYLRPETLFGTKFESYLNQQTVLTTNDLKKVIDWEGYMNE